VVSLEPLKVFVCREGLAHFCTEPYKPLDPRKLNQDLRAHVTNTNLNKVSLSFSHTTNDNCNKDNNNDNTTTTAIIMIAMTIITHTHTHTHTHTITITIAKDPLVIATLNTHHLPHNY
jgi:hypothetical protein